MLMVPSALADAIVTAEMAHREWYEAFLTGDKAATRRKLIEWQEAAQRRLELTPPPR